MTCMYTCPMVNCLCLPGRELKMSPNNRLFTCNLNTEVRSVRRGADYRLHVKTLDENQLIGYVLEISQNLRLTSLEMFLVPDILLDKRDKLKLNFQHIIIVMLCRLLCKVLKPSSDKYHRD